MCRPRTGAPRPARHPGRGRRADTRTSVATQAGADGSARYVGGMYLVPEAPQSRVALESRASTALWRTIGQRPEAHTRLARVPCSCAAASVNTHTHFRLHGDATITYANT
eukprot:3431511-Prymnesium_polylepis.1